MHVEQFAYLIEIKKHSSLSAAAEILHLSPQALSRSISRMEEELGYTVLNRSFKGVQLTEKGEQLVNAASSFLEELDSIAGTPKKELPMLKGSYDILTVHGKVNYLLLLLLTALVQDFPLLETNIIRRTAPEVESAILSGEAEFGMCCVCSINDKQLTNISNNLQFTPLLPCRLYALIPNDFPLSVYKSLSIKSLLPYPLIVHQDRAEKSSPLLSLINLFGKPKQILSKPSVILCEELSSAGVGIYLQIALENDTEHFTESKSVTILPIRDNIQIMYGYLTKKNHPLSVTAQVILNYIHEQAKTLLLSHKPQV